VKITTDIKIIASINVEEILLGNIGLECENIWAKEG